MSALQALEDLEPLFKIFFSFVCKEVPGTMGKNYWPIYGKSKAGRWRNLSTSTSDRVLCKIYRLGEKFRVSEWQEFPRGGGGGNIPPRNVLKRICAEMQSGAFWDTIVRNVTVVFYFIFLSWSRSDNVTILHVPSHPSLEREYLLHVHWPRRVWISL